MPKSTSLSRSRSGSDLVTHIACGALCLFPLAPLARGTLTVAGGIVTEGNNPAAPLVMPFTLNNSPAAATPTTWEYATSSDTAREGTDYVGIRGTVTIPANETTAVIDVALVSDRRPESDESFALIVWPQGGAPVPALTEIPKPVTGEFPPFEWVGESGPAVVTEQRWFTSGRIGRRIGDTWPVERTVTIPVGSVAGSLHFAVNGRWLVATDFFSPIDQSTTSQRLFQYDTLPGDMPLDALHSFAVPRLPGPVWPECAVANSVAALGTTDSITFYRLSLAQPPGVMGVCPVGRVPGSGFAFSGRRLAIPTSPTQPGSNEPVAVRIMEAADDDLTTWTETKILLSARAPLALEGDILIAARTVDLPVTRTEFVVFERNYGGAGAWGETGVLPLPATMGTVYPRTIQMRGGIALVPDPISPSGDPLTPGRVLVFVRDGLTRGWSVAGQFSAPTAAAGDFFGSALAMGGRDAVVVAPGSVVPSTAWAGSFPGAVATITDDDLPAATLSGAAVLEPSTGAVVMEVRFDLSTPATVPVSFNWRTRNGSASAGSDYEETALAAIIPAGQAFARLRVPIFADAALEEDESLFVDVDGLSGATLATASVACRIRDTDRQPVVAVTAVSLYEEAPSTAINVRMYPGEQPLAVPWQFETMIKDGMDLPNDTVGLADAGADIPQGSGLLTASAPATRQIAIEAAADSREELWEKGTVALDLPPLTTTATFATRLVGWAPAGYGADVGPPTTDGDWVAVSVHPATDPTATSGLSIYGRNSDRPGGWEPIKIIRPVDAGQSSWPTGTYRLRRGRLVFYDYQNGRAWVFRHDQGGPRQWGLEASFDTERSDFNAAPYDSDFDGETFVTFRLHTMFEPPQVSIHSFEGGRWRSRQAIIDPRLEGDTHPLRRLPSVSGDTIAFLAANRGAPPTVGLLQRNGPPDFRWSIMPPLVLDGPPLTDGQVTLRVANDCLAFGLTSNNPRTTSLYRLQSNGSWTLEASIPDIILFLQPGVFIGDSESWVDTGEAADRWKSVGATPHGEYWLRSGLHTSFENPTTADLQRNVMVSSRNLPLGNTTSRGFTISEAGAEYIVYDEDTFEFVTYPPSSLVELPNTQGGAIVEVRANAAVPMDVSVPFRTMAGGTATAGLDYLPVDGVMRIAAGQSAGRFTIPLLPDAVRDPSETILVEVGPPSYGVIRRSQETLTLGDRPIVLQAPIPAATLFEPPSGQETFFIPFRLTHPFSETFSFNYRIAALSATAADCTLGNGATIVPAGQTTVLVPVTVLADALTEGPESVTVSVTVPGIGSGSASTTLSTEVSIDDAQTGGGVPDSYASTQASLLDFSPGRNVLDNDAAGFQQVGPGRAARFGSVEWQADGTFRYQSPANFIGSDRFAYTAGNGGAVVLPATAAWKFLHPLNGKDPGTTVAGFQQNWQTPGFDDSSWASGTGLMGYGVLGTGAGQPIDTPIGIPTGNRLTAYFRTAFTAPVGAPAGLTLRLAFDDAVIIYLNGTELGRYAKAPDPVFLGAADTYALVCANVHDADEETAVRTLVFPAAQAQPGNNVVAISLHNQSPGSSDLGLRVAEISTGFGTTPVRVNVTVTDAALPPVTASDTYAVPTTTTPLDSLFLAGGSAYANDGLLSETGAAYDPILEVETGGAPVGPVTFDKDTGHFRIAGPPGFFGTTAFTYRVRDKDGWSNTATVSLSVTPSRAFDVWRQENYGGGSSNPQSEATGDSDGDGLASLVEFALGTEPTVPDPASILEFNRRGGAWVAEFLAKPGFGRDVFIGLESSVSLEATKWQRLAWLNDVYPSVEVLAPGVTMATAAADSGRQRYFITLPPIVDQAGFLRLRVSRERHVMDP